MKSICFICVYNKTEHTKGEQSWGEKKTYDVLLGKRVIIKAYFNSFLLFKILIVWKRINCIFHASDFFFYTYKIYLRGVWCKKNLVCEKYFPFNHCLTYKHTHTHTQMTLIILWNSNFNIILCIDYKRNWNFQRLLNKRKIFIINFMLQHIFCLSNLLWLEKKNVTNYLFWS